MKHIIKLAIFDFDGTLFRSPEPPVGWQGSWWGNSLSLAPPIVPEVPSIDWWNADVVARAKAAMADEDTVTALVTGREALKFTLRVRELLEQVGLKFDHLELSNGDQTDKFKLGVISALLREYPPIRGVSIWEDNAVHLQKFADHVEMGGRAALPHLITTTRHAPGTASPVVVASRYLAQ